MTDQDLWDRAALAMMPACLTVYTVDGIFPQFATVAQAAANYADAFMKERAKRMAAGPPNKYANVSTWGEGAWRKDEFGIPD